MHPAKYRLSSYRANAQGAVDTVCSAHEEYVRLGGLPAEREAAYRELFRHYLESGIVDDIRNALNNELVVGTSRFKDEIQAITNRPVRKGQPGRPRKTDSRY